MGLKDQAKRLKDARSRTSADAVESEEPAEEVGQDADFDDAEPDQDGDTRELGLKSIGEAAIEGAGLRTRKGKIGKLRVAKAAVNPVATAGKVAKGVSAEVARQGREIKKTGFTGRSATLEPVEPSSQDDDSADTA